MNKSLEVIIKLEDSLKNQRGIRAMVEEWH